MQPLVERDVEGGVGHRCRVRYGELKAVDGSAERHANVVYGRCLRRHAV